MHLKQNSAFICSVHVHIPKIKLVTSVLVAMQLCATQKYAVYLKVAWQNVSLREQPDVG